MTVKNTEREQAKISARIPARHKSYLSTDIAGIIDQLFIGCPDTGEVSELTYLPTNMRSGT